MNKRHFVAIILSTLLLAGCGMNPAVTEKEMKDAASFALNVNASKVTISNVDKKGVKTNFVATVNNTAHRCYVTKVGAAKLYGVIPLGAEDTVSDAICAGTNNGTSNTTCDALSRKAGRC